MKPRPGSVELQPGIRESPEIPGVPPASGDAPCGVCVVDSQLRLWALDRRAAAILGPGGALPGQAFADLIRFLWPEPLAGNVVERIRRALSSDPAPAAGQDLRRFIGGPASSREQILPVTLPDGTPGAVCSVFGLSRVHAEQVHNADGALWETVDEDPYVRLRDSQARLQVAIEASGMGTFVWEIEPDRTEPDRRMLSLFGLPPDGTLRFAEVLRTLVHPDDRARFAEALTFANDPDGPGQLQDEIRVLHPDGGERWLAITARTEFEPAIVAGSVSRRAVRMSGIGSDITERKRRETNVGLMAAVADEFAGLSCSDDIVQMVGERLAAHLRLSCAYVLEVDETLTEARLMRLWKGDDLPGAAPLSEFLNDDLVSALRASDTVVVRDTASDLRTDGLAYAGRQIRAFVKVPVLRAGRVRFVLTVADASPRHWREDEVSLCRELSARFLPRLERARAEQTVASDLRDTRLLRDLSVRLVSEADTGAFFDAIVAAATAITAADAGCMHLVDGSGGGLVLLTTSGFDAEMTRLCGRCDGTSPAPYGRALASGQRVFVDFDDEGAPDPDGSLRLTRDAGFASAQSTPLVTRAGHLVGLLSTHWRTRRRLSERELRFLDLLARQAAEMIERRRTDDMLRERERELSAELADTRLLQTLSAH